MKTLVSLIAGSLFAINAIAQSADANINAGGEMWKDKYCAKKKDNKTVIMHNDKELTSDVTTASGVQIKTDGTVIRKDGSSLALRDGQCVNTEGNMEGKGKMKKSDSKEKTKKEPSKNSHKTGY